jgi:hypothetical protein
LGNINAYLKNPEIPKVAKIYYVGKFRASDDDSTFSILDSLSTKNNAARPFYILLVSKMAKSADGALSEELWFECEAFFEKHPDDLIEFLYCKNPLVKKEFRAKWVSGILGEIQISHEKNERRYLDTSKREVFRKCRPENKKNLQEFYYMLNKELRNINKN